MSRPTTCSRAAATSSRRGSATRARERSSRTMAWCASTPGWTRPATARRSSPCSAFGTRTPWSASSTTPPPIYSGRSSMTSSARTRTWSSAAPRSTTRRRCPRPRVGACPETAVHGSGGTVSASIRRRWTRVRERPTRSAPHRRSDGAPAPVLRRHGPRVRRARLRCEAAATPNARSRRRFKATQERSHSSRTFVTPRKMTRRKPIACLISACRRKTCRTRAGRIAQRGGGGAVAAPMRRRGRRPIEAPGSAAPNRSGDGAPASPHAVSGHAPRLGGGLAAALAAARLLRVGARAAQVVQVVRVLHQPVVHVVADLLARRADEVDALDGLVDALAVQDAAAQLLDANAEQLLVLALDLAATGLVLGEVLLAVLGVVLVAVEDGERLGLATAALVALTRARHGRIIPPQRA